MRSFNRARHALVAVILGGVLGLGSATAPAQGNGWDLGEGAIVLSGDQGVRFRVYAPGAQTVAVAGEFNGWSISANVMVRDAEGYYSTTVASARPGQRYKFVVNGTLWRKDPWSLQVEGSDEAANSVIVDLRAHQWQSDSWQTPRIEELVIYQLHLKGMQYNGDGLTYRHGQVFNDFTNTKLDYLTDLGVNAIHIMPMNEFPGEDSWGYNHVFFHAPESSYGTAQDFQRLVDECHKRGIAVILDLCYNHTDGRENTHLWDFDGTANNQYGGNGQFYYNDNRALTLWGPEPNYGHPRTRARLFDNTRLFADLYRIDGFRMDAVGFIRGESTDGNDWFGWQAEDGWNFLRDFNNLARSYHDGRFLSIAEDIATNGDITKNASEGGAGFLSQWTETNMRWMMASPSDSDRSIENISKIIGHYYPVNYGMHEMIKYHSSHDKVGALNNGPRLPVLIGDPNEWYTRRRTMLANATIMFSPGTPLFFMGDEKYETRSFREQVGEGLDWTLRSRNRAFYEFSRDLVALKVRAEALHHNNLEIPHSVPADNLITWRRWGQNGEVIVFAANFGNFDKDFWLPFPNNGRWLEVINSAWTHYGEFDNANDRKFDVSNNWAQVRMPGYSIVAFSQTHELAPGRVWNVTPLNNAVSGGSSPSLAWGKTSRAESYDVYFGTDAAAVAAATRTSPEFKGTQATTTFDPGALAGGDVRYWRIDASNGIGTTKSEVFRFTHAGTNTATNGRIAWTPAQPMRGGNVTVTYFPQGGPLEGRTPITAHRGFRVAGTDWTSTVGQTMTRQSDGSHTVTIPIPANAEAVNIVFNHAETTWDNNSRQDWRIDTIERSTSSGLVIY